MPKPNNNRIELSGIVKSFRSREGGRVLALSDVTFGVPEATIACLAGPTGCGKTTILRMVAGLESADSGRVSTPEAEGGRTSPSIGYLTQKHSLLPWLTTRQNVELPLVLQGLDRRKRRGRSEEIMHSLGLSEFTDLYPHELSGGMQQRAAMSRLMASEADCWLMDEPFSALDEDFDNTVMRLTLDQQKILRSSAC